MTPVEQLIELVRNHPDVTAREDETYWMMTLNGRHSIHLQVLKRRSKPICVIKVCQNSRSEVMLDDDEVRQAAMQRIADILMPNPLTDILKDFKL
jgi:hypothetical protein